MVTMGEKSAQKTAIVVGMSRSPVPCEMDTVTKINPYQVLESAALQLLRDWQKQASRSMCMRRTISRVDDAR